jgi:hypothetical protein
MRIRIGVRGCGVAALVALTVLVTFAPGAEAAEAPCAPYMFIGVRGSGDPQDTMGSQVGPEWGALSADLQAGGIDPNSGAVISDLALHYPAVPVEHAYHFPGGVTITGPDFQARNYAESVLRGAIEVIKEANRCKGSKLILAGHSQGAHAIMLALPLIDHHRVLAVSLFGDPLFKGSSYAGRGSFDPSRNGLAAGVKIPLLGSIPGLLRAGMTQNVLDAILDNPYAPDLKGRLFDYCNDGDGVCQGPFHCSFTSGCQVNGFSSHSAYKDNGDTVQAAAIIARLIRDDQASQGHPIPEPVPVSKGPVDVVFAIDSTGSMEPIIDSVRADVQALASQIAVVEPDYRLALVTYRDALPYCDDTYQATTVQDFTTDLAAFGSGLGSLVAEGGCDEPESVLTGAMQGLGLAFRPGATRVEVLVGDAPGHEPDPVTGNTVATVVARAQSQSVAIYGVDAGSAAETFVQLTGPTGGKVVSADQASQVATAIQQAITAQATAPTAAAGAVAARASRTARMPSRSQSGLGAATASLGGPVGVPLLLSAASSWSPLGRALTYHWDLNSDGVSDINTDIPVLAYTWPSPFNGEVTLTVTDSAGQSAVSRVPVSISGPGLASPGRPSSPRLRHTRHGLQVAWRAARTGGRPSAYVLRSGNGGVLAYVAAGVQKTQTATLGHLRSLRGLKLRVSALNAAGESPISAPSSAGRRH